MTDLMAGFRDAPVEAAATFRAALKALAEPGTVVPLAPRLDRQERLAVTTAALVLTLLDNDTPVYLDAALSNRDLVAWLRFHTGAPITDDIATASFAVIGDAAAFADFARLAIGTAEYPDRAATLILQVDALLAGQGARLSGPGISGEGSLAVAPGMPRLWQALAANHALYPLGFDTLLAAPDAIAGLPRSTRISLDGGA